MLLQELNLMGNVNCTVPEEVFHSKFSSLCLELALPALRGFFNQYFNTAQGGTKASIFSKVPFQVNKHC